MKVYIAYAGSYDDRRACGVFMLERRAREVSDLENSKMSPYCRANSPDVEEWEVDDLCEAGCGDEAGHVPHDLCAGPAISKIPG